MYGRWWRPARWKRRGVGGEAGGDGAAGQVMEDPRWVGLAVGASGGSWQS